MIALSIFNPIKIDMTYKSTICKTTTTNGLDKENLFMRRLVFSYQRVRNREKYQSPDSRGIEEGPDSEEEGKRGSQLPLGCSHPAARDLARKRSPPLWPSGGRWRRGAEAADRPTSGLPCVRRVRVRAAAAGALDPLLPGLIPVGRNYMRIGSVTGPRGPNS